MKRFVVVGLTICLLCFANRLEALMAEYEPGFSVAQVTDVSTIVCVGRVVAKEFVFRENVSPPFTTDITIQVEDFIKGEANAGEMRVKFMMLGGRDDRPETPAEKRKRLRVSDEPDYELNEKVLMFLSRTKRASLNYPHGGLRPFWATYGKRKVEDDKVQLYYTLGDDSIKAVKVPLDFATALSKAAHKNKEAVARLENQVRAQIVIGLGTDSTLPDTLLDSIKTEVQTIIDADEED